MFIGLSGSNHSTFDLYRAPSAGVATPLISEHVQVSRGGPPVREYPCPALLLTLLPLPCYECALAYFYFNIIF